MVDNRLDTVFHAHRVWAAVSPNTLNAGPLAEAEKWLRQWERFWNVRLGRLEALIEQDKAKKENSDG